MQHINSYLSELIQHLSCGLIWNFSSVVGEVLTALGCCGLFLAIVAIVKWRNTIREWGEGNYMEGLEREGCRGS